MSMQVKLFADGAKINEMLEMYKNPLISGFTTNPTLMRKAGVTDYQKFAQEVLSVITDKPISFEVFSDEFDEMEEQALKIGSWGKNVYIKIPVTNTKGVSSVKLVRKLSSQGIKINVTAMLTAEQVAAVLSALQNGPGGYVSVFAGRIADTGVDPLPVMQKVVGMLKAHPHIELIWASPRELYNVIQANTIGCHIITVTSDILKKISLIDKDLTEYSLDTVKMFFNDATAAGYKI